MQLRKFAYVIALRVSICKLATYFKKSCSSEIGQGGILKKALSLYFQLVIMEIHAKNDVRV